MGKALLAAAVALGLLVVFVAGIVFYLSWSACLGGESDALTGFPHYAEPKSGPSPLMGACEVRYTTKASRKEVLGYYDEHLREDGWNVLGYMTVYRPPIGDGDASQEAVDVFGSSRICGRNSYRSPGQLQLLSQLRAAKSGAPGPPR